MLEKRFASRALRTIPALRKKMTPELLHKVIDFLLPQSPVKSGLLAQLRKVQLSSWLSLRFLNV